MGISILCKTNCPTERRKLGGSTPNVNASGGQRKCGSRDEKEGRGSSGARAVWDDPSPGWSFFHQKVFFSTEKN